MQKLSSFTCCVPDCSKPRLARHALCPNHHRIVPVDGHLLTLILNRVNRYQRNLIRVHFPLTPGEAKDVQKEIRFLERKFHELHERIVHREAVDAFREHQKNKRFEEKEYAEFLRLKEKYESQSKAKGRREINERVLDLE